MTYFAVETQTFENMSSKAKQKVSVNYIMTKSVSWFWMCLLFKDSSLLLQTDRNHIFFCGKVLFSLGVRLAVAYIITAQIWKSLHIVAAIAVAVLTREREISTCPDHIPALALNSTHLLCKLESTPRSLFAKYSDKRTDKSGRRDCVTTWSRYPDTLRNSMRHSRNPTRLSWITLHRSSIKRDVPQGNRGEKREDWCRSQLFASTLCQSASTIHLASIESSLLRLQLQLYTQLQLCANLCVMNAKCTTTTTCCCHSSLPTGIVYFSSSSSAS